MIGYLKNLFAKPSAREMAHRELEDARRELLVCERHVEWYTAEVDFQRKRIARLEVSSGAVSYISTSTAMGDMSHTEVRTLHSKGGGL